MKTKEQTREAVLAEAKALRAMKPKVLRRSAFGDDHHAAIDAQIETLESELSDDDIYDKDDEHDGEWTEGQISAALEARQWMDGDEAISPTANWKPLCK